ncbi:MAG: prolyl-tRNA synthetase associated domain-containing protein [Gemmatimonadetes bacterium]|nr:prolyl-tRNA synthetase associated domain-containing protein [Gemmatimonadota bacterium]
MPDDSPSGPAPDVAGLLARLDQLGVRYDRHDHAAVFTCDEAERTVPAEVVAAHTKNLFLRDQKGRRHWLVVTDCAKQVDLKALAPLIGADKLGLASPERLLRFLGVTPGSVTVLGLVNDRDRAVELVVDRDVWETERWRAHPLVNTATLILERSGVEAFLAATGHTPRIVAVPSRA